MALSMGDEVIAAVNAAAARVGRQVVVEKEYDILAVAYPRTNRYDVKLVVNSLSGQTIPVGYYILWTNNGNIDLHIDETVIDAARELGDVEDRRPHNYSDLPSFIDDMEVAVRGAARWVTV